MATPHIGAEKDQIAESILLPGDPLRAKFIAENYFDEPVQFNTVRNMFGYTGIWKGERVSVMGTGMGIPSHAIYVEELCSFFGVKRLMRVGSCGAIQEDVAVRDIILGMSACTDSAINHARFKGADYAPTASFSLLETAYQTAKAMNLACHVGPIVSTDQFYAEEEDLHWRMWAKYGALALEMEAAALYTIAAKHQAQALTILTVSDSMVTGESTTSQERESTFTDMMELALRTITSVPG